MSSASSLRILVWMQQLKSNSTDKQHPVGGKDWGKTYCFTGLLSLRHFLSHWPIKEWADLHDGFPRWKDRVQLCVAQSRVSSEAPILKPIMWHHFWISILLLEKQEQTTKLGCFGSVCVFCWHFQLNWWLKVLQCELEQSTAMKEGREWTVKMVHPDMKME